MLPRRSSHAHCESCGAPSSLNSRTCSYCRTPYNTSSPNNNANYSVGSDVDAPDELLTMIQQAESVGVPESILEQMRQRYAESLVAITVDQQLRPVARISTLVSAGMTFTEAAEALGVTSR